MQLRMSDQKARPSTILARCMPSLFIWTDTGLQAARCIKRLVLPVSSEREGERVLHRSVLRLPKQVVVREAPLVQQLNHR